jgi:hypothetical protein
MAILPKDAAALLIKDILILCERVAAFFLMRYSYFAQACGHPSGKKDFNFM